MTSLHVLTARFDGVKKDKGAAAVEYGLLVGLIAVAIIAVLVALGPELRDLFQRVVTALEGIA
jgi:pilus assembly protein Flp/PilA